MGVDSGPLHVAGATATPAVGVWTGHHPVHFFDLGPNVTHLVPGDHARLAAGPGALRYFEENYRHRVYRQLYVELPAIVEALLTGGDVEHAAPHLVDVEVLGIIQRDLRLRRLDPTAATQAVDDLRDWPGERFGHRLLLGRAWELRDRVRSWDGVYVALAEALGGTLLTLDRRLGRVVGLGCPVEVVE